MHSWRLALEADDDSIVEMCRELNREDPCSTPVPEEYTRRTLKVLRENPVRGCAVVLDLNGTVEGYAFLISYWSNELGGDVCTIDELYVRPRFRSLGYGRKLTESLFSENPLWPGRPVAFELEVSPANTRARSLYLRLGFEPIRNSLLRLNRMS